MPYALPLGKRHYVSLVKVPRQAPHVEPGTIQEFKGKGRYGEGSQIRVLPHHAIAVGRWTERPAAEQAILDEFQTTGVVRLIDDSERDEIGERLTAHNEQMMRHGWTPPVWHWAYCEERLAPLAVRCGILRVGGAYHQYRLGAKPQAVADFFENMIGETRRLDWKPGRTSDPEDWLEDLGNAVDEED